MTIWLANQKFILTKENTRQRRFRLRKNNEADKTSEPIQSNPIHGWIQSMSNSALSSSSVVLHERRLSDEDTDPHWRRAWPNIVNLRLLWILLQMLYCCVWFITEAFDTKSNQRSPSRTSQVWHLKASSFCSSDFIKVQVSAPYNSTAETTRALYGGNLVLGLSLDCSHTQASWFMMLALNRDQRASMSLE